MLPHTFRIKSVRIQFGKIASEDSEKEEKSTEEKPMDDKQLWEEMQKFGDYEEEEMAKEEAGEASDAEFDIMQPIGFVVFPF